MKSLTSHLEPPAWFFSHELVKEALLQVNIIISVYVFVDFVLDGLAKLLTHTGTMTLVLLVMK